MGRALALASLMVVIGCGDEADSPDAQESPGGATTDAQVGTTPDGGASSAAIPLVLWVDDLLDHHTDDDSAPDTVHDKNIFDDENPATFDLRFGK